MSATSDDDPQPDLNRFVHQPADRDDDATAIYHADTLRLYVYQNGGAGFSLRDRNGKLVATGHASIRYGGIDFITYQPAFPTREPNAGYSAARPAPRELTGGGHQPTSDGVRAATGRAAVGDDPPGPTAGLPEAGVSDGESGWHSHPYLDQTGLHPGACYEHLHGTLGITSGSDASPGHTHTDRGLGPSYRHNTAHSHAHRHGSDAPHEHGHGHPHHAGDPGGDEFGHPVLPWRASF